MQGEDGPKDQNQPIRDKQIAQIARELIAGSADPSLPMFICGDLNTQRRDRRGSIQRVRELEAHGRDLRVRNSPEFLVTLDDRRVHNDLANYDTGRVAELDYILLRRAGQAITGSLARCIVAPAGLGRTGRAKRSVLSLRGPSHV